MYKIYMHTCPNNEKYIGITKYDNPNERWKNGSGYIGQWFYNAIEKFGWDNIKHEIIDYAQTEREALDLEHKYIIWFDSWCPGRGYNDSLGNNLPACKPIKVVDINLIFPTAKKCSEYLGVPFYGVYKSGTHYGHVFKYVGEEDVEVNDKCIT